MEGKNPSSQYQAFLKLDILKQLYSLIEFSLKEAASNNLTFQAKSTLESQFVFNRLKDHMQFLKSELGMVTMRELLGDANISQNLQYQLQNFKEEIASDFKKKMNLMKEHLQKMQKHINDQKQMILSKCKENKELKEQIEALEKLLDKQSEYFQEQIEESNQSIKQRIDKVIEEAQQVLDDPDKSESKQSQSQSVKSEKPKQKTFVMITQEEKPIISQENFKKKLENDFKEVFVNPLVLQKANKIGTQQQKVANEYDLKTFDIPVFVVKSDNGNIFTGGIGRQLVIFTKGKTETVQLGEFINGGIIYNNDLYLFVEKEIRIMDTTTFEVKATIPIQSSIAKTLRIQSNSMICFESQGFIDIFSFDLNTVTHSYRISSEQSILDAVQGDMMNEYALATGKGLIFIDIADGKLTEKDHYFDDQAIRAINRDNKQQYVFYSSSYRLIVFDRSQQKSIKEIQMFYVKSIHYVKGVDIGHQVRFMIMNDKEGIKVFDLSDYSLTKIADASFDFEYYCKYSVFQEIDQDGNLKILAFEWIYDGKNTGKSTKLKEITIDLH